MKILMMCMIFLTSLIPTWFDIDGTQAGERELRYNDFIDNAKTAYDYYYEYKKVNDDNYIYSIVVGKVKNEMYYDIFYFDYSQQNTVRVEIDGCQYSFESTQSGSYYYYSKNGFQNKGTENIEVYLFSGIIKSNSVTIPNNYDSINGLDGLGKGAILSYLDPVTGANKSFITIIIISVAVISICLIGLGILLIIKLGKKNASPMGLQKRDILDEIKEKKKIEIEVLTSSKPVQTNMYITPNENNLIQNKAEQVYEKNARYDDENENEETNNNQTEEVIKEVDIEALLLMRGYHTDYSLMTEEEKNEVMVYLMVLRKTNQLSSTQYQKEVVKLWRK